MSDAIPEELLSLGWEDMSNGNDEYPHLEQLWSDGSLMELWCDGETFRLYHVLSGDVENTNEDNLIFETNNAELMANYCRRLHLHLFDETKE